jgi:hypothetical protein
VLRHNQYVVVLGPNSAASAEVNLSAPEITFRSHAEADQWRDAVNACVGGNYFVVESRTTNGHTPQPRFKPKRLAQTEVPRSVVQSSAR